MNGDSASLLQALQACGSHDNGIRSAAESALKRFSQQEGYVQHLLFISCSKSPEPQVRQLALTELRKRATRPTLSPQERAHVRAGMQQILDESMVAKALQRIAVEVLGAAAKHALPAGEWPDFLPWLAKTTQSSDASHRELAISLFGILVSYLGQEMQEQLPELLQVCKVGLGDQESRVQRVTLRLLSAVIGLENTLPEPMSLLDVMPALFLVLQRAIDRQDFETSKDAFSTLLDLVESRVTIPSTHLPQLIQWILTVASQQSYSTEDFRKIRMSAIVFLEYVARDRPKQFAKTGLVSQTTAVLCQVIAEPYEQEENDDSDGETILSIASQALDEMAKELPGSQVFPQVLSQALQKIKSPALTDRKAACIILAMATEGCSKLVRKNLSAILQLIAEAVQDKEHSVRGSAAQLIGNLAEYCQPEVTECSRDLLLAIFHVLKNSNGAAEDHACYALQALCETLGEDKNLANYIVDLMTNLGQLLQNSCLQTKLAALKSISWTAEAAGKDFHPFVAQLIPFLHQYMKVKEGEALQLRGAATECMGSLFAAVGFDSLQNYFQETMHLAIQGIELDAIEIKEYTHFAFAQIAHSAKEHFARWIPEVVQFAVRSLETDDGGLKPEENGNSNMSPCKSEDLASEDTHSEEDDGRLEIRTAQLEEKAAAIQALAMYAESCPLSFQQFLPSTLDLICRMSDYFNEIVREEACKCLGTLLTATKTLVASGEAGTSGVQSHQAVLHHVATTGAKKLIELCVDDDSSDTVAAAIESLAVYAEGVPWGLDMIKQMDSIATAVFDGTLLCQEVVSDFDDWQDDDIKENKDVALISAVSDLVPALIRTGNADYCQEWSKNRWSTIHNKLKAKTPSAVRSCMLGLAADLVKDLGQSIPKSELEKLLLSAKKEAKCEEKDNRQHAAFFIGMLGQAVPELVHQQLNSILMALHPLLADKETDIVRDNAVAAVARLICKLPLDSFPLEQVVPILLTALPLKEDLEEAEPVCHCLLRLTQDPSATHRLQDCMPKIHEALTTCLRDPRIPEPIQSRINSSLQDRRQ